MYIMIKGLKEKGYEIVQISKLIYKKNYQMDHEGRQFSVGENDSSGKNEYSKNMNQSGKSCRRHGFLYEFDDKNRVVIYNGDR